eukprot:gene5572-9388_t
MKFVFLLVFVIVTLVSTETLNYTQLLKDPNFIRIVAETKQKEKRLDFHLSKLTFPCKKLNTNHPEPEDASKLRFTDIKVMMAMGDSITAGFAMDDKTNVGFLYEYRGLSGIIGGDENTLSVYNYFNKVGSSMNGGSVGKGFPWNAVRWPWHISQLDYIISEAKKDEKINFEKDWKLIDILMGANDLNNCNDPESIPNAYEIRINKTIAAIHEKIPRVFINLLLLPEHATLDTYNVGKESVYCRTIWRIITSIKEQCMFKSDESRLKLQRFTNEYNKKIQTIKKYWNSKRRKDFLISVQPSLKKLRVPDRTWATKFDCFHPSVKANKMFSIGLWNSMLLPDHKKPTVAVDRFLCPHEDTLLQ